MQNKIIFSIFFIFALTLQANLLEDLFGVGARAKAMGGTGVASANDFSATYYNPAQLSGCKNETVVLGYNTLNTDFNTVSGSASIPSHHLKKKGALSFGGCLDLPAKFNLGLYAAMNPSSIASFEAKTVTADPIFPLYWDGFDLPSIMISSSFELLGGLSVGGGMSLTVDAKVASTTKVEAGITGGTISELSAKVDVLPQISSIIGLSYSPWKWVTFGAAYRSEITTKYDIEADVVIEVYYPEFNTSLNPKGSISFSPNQAAFGISLRPVKQLEVTSDVTWYEFSRYQGPFAVPHPIDFFSIFVPRVGIEYVHDKFLALRAGYQYRPTPGPTPASADLNLLDNDVHTASVGMGAKWEISESITLHVDCYGSIGFMPLKEVRKDIDVPTYKTYQFSGQIYDVGTQFTIGY